MRASQMFHRLVQGRSRAWLASLAVFVAASLATGAAAAAEPSASAVFEQAVDRMPTVMSAPRGDADPSDAAQPFHVPTGFAVERVFSVPRDELGSWVSLATDGQGRLIASDQGDKGLVRITPAPLDGSAPTRVERIPVPLTSAQGLLWAFDSLYVVCNGGPGSGLYRVTDSDHDDMLDTVEKLRQFDGAGEHGPHTILLSPDGERLFVICGNHTKPPFAVTNVTEPQTMGGIRTEQRRVTLAADGSSRLPANWDEDQIIPRMWDANGHAVGILAPGGFIVSTDRDGKTWELWSSGYRNPYDMAFHADGELFTYDADMEWDFGMPWYRPTRVNHATSGSELGWRSGSGKWPAAFPDSLPAVVDIGPGSPVGVAFGYGTAFPSRYQRALYVCDWTFGTIYAIHLAPDGASYQATKEEFVSRTPLPLTDLTVGRDGALYFAVGGRGGQSELYRVRYIGSEPTTPVDGREQAGASERKLRHSLEAYHHRLDDPAAAIEAALPQLSHSDRFIRYAARVALEHQPLDRWQDRALAIADPVGRITAAIAVARQAEPEAQSAIFAALDSIDPTSLDDAGRLDLARACELAIVRLGDPPDDVKARIAERISPIFPTGSYELDRELASLLVAVRAPGIVSRLVSLLGSSSTGSGNAVAPPTTSLARETVAPQAAHNLAPDEDELRRLLERNADYGAAVRATLENRSDLLQIHYAYALRTVTEKESWSEADRKAYLAWFARARAWAGGNSFQKFLTNMELDSLAGLSDTEKLALEATGIRAAYVPPPLPKPQGPGRTWTVDAVLAAAEHGLAPGTRDFANGRTAFAAARCIVCHRFGGDGGATGPDLTQAAGRFQVKDLIEAIVEPSRVVSDQYRASIVQTSDGRVVTGRIVAESPEKIVVVTDPESATACVEIERSAIDEIVSSPTSLMPAGLLDQLNENETLDLIAYVLSRGSKKDPRFAKPPKRR
ncbi:MAG: c-type cytochrome [Pirellulales bacterium]